MGGASSIIESFFGLKGTDENLSQENAQVHENSTTPQQSSPKLNKEFYMFCERRNEFLRRLPGEVEGQQFVVEDCSNCEIYLLDYAAGVTVDDCTNCVIYIGPVESSVFLRHCTDCFVTTACKQFRASNCKKCTVSLHVSTPPVLEKCSHLTFKPFDMSYKELPSQFQACGLKTWTNRWTSVFDFTPNDDSYSIDYTNRDPQSGIPYKLDALDAQRVVADDFYKSDLAVPLLTGGKEHLIAFVIDGLDEKDVDKFGLFEKVWKSLNAPIGSLCSGFMNLSAVSELLPHTVQEAQPLQQDDIVVEVVLIETEKSSASADGLYEFVEKENRTKLQEIITKDQ
eukprot:Platyproteum_vivax@DN1632_c0_g1_i1.p1